MVGKFYCRELSNETFTFTSTFAEKVRRHTFRQGGKTCVNVADSKPTGGGTERCSASNCGGRSGRVVADSASGQIGTFCAKFCARFPRVDPSTSIWTCFPARARSLSPQYCVRERRGGGVLISSFSFSLSPFLYDRIFSHTLAPECTSARLLPGLSIVFRIRMRRLHERMPHKGMPGDRAV